MWNAGLKESQAGIKIARRNVNNVRYANDTTLMVESKEILKSLLMKLKEENEQVSLKLNIHDRGIQSHHFMANRWGKSRNNKRFYFLGFQNRCGWWLHSHEIKRHLLLGKKAMTNLDNALKSRDITLPTKVCLVKTMIFPIVMYGCQSWIIRKAECQRIDVFKLWCCRRLLRVPWTTRKWNPQS